MSDEITIDGEQYISSKRAAEFTKYTQDYVGQLARGGQIRARRVGGLWYIGQKSLEEHKTKADSYKPVPPGYHANNEQESLLSFDGRAYVSSQYAAKITGYTPDYVGQLARAGAVLSRQIGNRWYVDRQSLMAHKDSKDALLAAVQAESVGIKRMQGPTDKEGSNEGGETFFKYVQDNRDLVPYTNTRVDDATRKESEAAASASTAIPIRVVPPPQNVVQKHIRVSIKPRTKTDVGSSGITRKNIAIPAVALTIVIILSLGFVSLKDYSQYASKIDGPAPSQSAAVGGVIFELRSYAVSLADFLEPYLTDEVLYQNAK